MALLIVSTRFSLSMENEQADAGRETAERETKFSGANGDGEIFIFPVRPTTKHGWTRNSCADVVLRATGVLLNYFVTNLITLLFRRFQL